MSSPKPPEGIPFKVELGSGPYWSFDPGLTTGWAHFNAQGDFKLFGSVKGLDRLTDFLEAITDVPKLIILEDYIINPNIKQGGTKVVASEAIGRIDHYARVRRIPVVKQPATIKPIGYKWAKAAVPKRKEDTHQMDAFVHGIYYLIDNKIKPNPILQEYKKNV